MGSWAQGGWSCAGCSKAVGYEKSGSQMDMSLLATALQHLP